ncbi:hypothetical protein scyTo_0010162 [Scyliorhinus torazame]|uniref:Uncharacterized protein n=1 Tax=Scyliorhinus torazame TaxID=75743 RepID=A0A401P188_SCYTO|nr:hypothetical protein [Scyliorhinus torazame]
MRDERNRVNLIHMSQLQAQYDKAHKKTQRVIREKAHQLLKNPERHPVTLQRQSDNECEGRPVVRVLAAGPHSPGLADQYVLGLPLRVHLSPDYLHGTGQSQRIAPERRQPGSLLRREHHIQQSAVLRNFPQSLQETWLFVYCDQET